MLSSTDSPGKAVFIWMQAPFHALVRVLKKHHDWEILVGVRNMGNSYMNKGW